MVVPVDLTLLDGVEKMLEKVPRSLSAQKEGVSPRGRLRSVSNWGMNLHFY